MRNWNVFLAVILFDYQEVYRVPMRNWNKYGIEKKFQKDSSLSRAYEELKLARNKNKLDPFTCLSRAYEELKQ